jgi:DNA-binding winged helix-turn-helix (wHTH) protein
MELFRNGSKVQLAPQPVRVLALLAASSGELITRDTLREKLWGPHTFIDFEHGLNFCIREIRVALGDSAREPRFIETLPRRGYRFIAKISGLPAEACRIEAYENYVRGRENLSKLDLASLERARADFERAISLDPTYAMAYSGLGAALSMRLVNCRDPQELKLAHAHLTRALELDPELAEPFPWLCYLNIRLSSFEKAIELGHRAIELLPNLVQGHYFLALAYVVASEHDPSCERDPSPMQLAVNHLLQAARVGPHWLPSWFVLSLAALSYGDYARAASFAGRLLQPEMPAGATGSVPFIGGELVIASASYRQGRRSEARQILLGFLARMETSDHMYRNSMSVTAGCLLGDIELRDDAPAAASAAYRRAWQSVREHTRMVAHRRLDARVHAGLAAAYAASGDRSRAGELLQTAVSLTTSSHDSEHAAAAADLGELYWGLATAFNRMGDASSTITMLQEAVAAGWRDGAWLVNDPEWHALHHDPRFQTLVSRLDRIPKLTFSEQETRAAAAH